MNDKVHTVEQVQSGGAIALQHDRDIAMAQEVLSPFSSMVSFTATKKMAEILIGSELVPTKYRQNLGDCMIALGIASRMGADPIMVMQNLYVVHGTPAWSGQFVIACINQSGHFLEPLRFIEVGTKGKDDWGYYAETTGKAGNKIKGPTITMALAIAEGWVPTKDPKTGKLRRNQKGKILGNPKWLSMPEMMLRYRAGSWFGRTECPEVLMGFQSRSEVDDANVLTIDPDTGEIIDPAKDKRPGTKFVDLAAVVEVPQVTVTAETIKPVDHADLGPGFSGEDEKKPQGETLRGPPAQQAPPEMTQAEGDRNTLLQDQGYYEDSGRFFNAKGDLWNPTIHATSKETQGPVINTDGSFRARRGVVKVPAEGEAPTPAAQQRVVEDDPIPDNPNHPGQQPVVDDDGGWD